ncbi:Copia protein, partial [Mucuna pruriens]
FGVEGCHKRHLKAVERILQYLKANYVGSVVDRRSTSGYCMFLRGNLVSWRSKKQNVVARSSAEAEFRAMAQGICEGLWMKIILDDLKVKYEGPIKHFIKEKLDNGLIVIAHVPTGLQVEDVFTKGLPTTRFQELNGMLSNPLKVPSKIQKALKDPKWVQVVKEKMKALEDNKTWNLVILPREKKIMGCKWDFSIKHKEYESIERYKARLVQRDIHKLMTLTIKSFFSLVAKLKWLRIERNLVMWRSKKKVMALSSAKAEFRVMTKGLCELLWLKELLKSIFHLPL